MSHKSDTANGSPKAAVYWCYGKKVSENQNGAQHVKDQQQDGDGVYECFFELRAHRNAGDAGFVVVHPGELFAVIVHEDHQQDDGDDGNRRVDHAAEDGVRLGGGVKEEFRKHRQGVV